jgi:hypothetical protein
MKWMPLEQSLKQSLATSVCVVIKITIHATSLSGSMRFGVADLSTSAALALMGYLVYSIEGLHLVRI